MSDQSDYNEDRLKLLGELMSVDGVEVVVAMDAAEKDMAEDSFRSDLGDRFSEIGWGW